MVSPLRQGDRRPTVRRRIGLRSCDGITDIARFADLSKADIEALGSALATIRRDIEDSLGERDAAYIRRAIALQRTLDAAARLVIGVSRSRTGWILGNVSLASAVENIEIGQNVGHGQWDWMNDPEIHSTAWEWDGAVAVAVLA